MRTLVVGGGLAGLSAAWALIEKGQDVTVLEAREGVALETSFANAGMLTPSMPEPWNGPGVFRDLFVALFDSNASMKVHLRTLPSLLSWGTDFLRCSRAKQFIQTTIDNYQLCRYSKQQTLRLAEKLSLSFDLVEIGTLCIFRDAHHFDERRKICVALQAFGLSWHELGVSELVNREPTLSSIADQLLGGIWLPDYARGNAHLYCREIAAAIESNGGEIQTETTVVNLWVESGAVRGVHTINDRIEADTVVVANGVHAPKLMRPIGVDLPIQPAKGYSLTADARHLGKLPNASIVDDLTHSVVNVQGHRLRIVGTAEFTGYEKAPTTKRISKTFDDLVSVLPQIAAEIDREDIRPWAGLRPMSSDGRPFIGATEIEGLYVNAGHGPLGWSMAAGAGSLLADQVLGLTSEIDARPFRVGR